MVLISVQSVETNNGYQFKNDFSESIIIDPKSKISLVSILFERSADFVVQLSSNMFKVRIGSPTNPLDTISIKPDTYTPSALADTLQTALNNKYSSVGHNWDVKYDIKKQEFAFHDTFQQSSIPLKKTDSYDTSEGNEIIVSGLGDLNFGGITNGTANYAISRDRIETNFVPSSIYGGSSADFEISFNTSLFPNTNPGVDTFGFLMGLTSGYLNPDEPTQQISPVGSAVNLGWLDCGIVYSRSTTGAHSVKFIEEGVSIGIDIPHTVRSGDRFKVMLATDDPSLPNHPTYWYKRVNDTDYHKFTLSGASQTFSYAKWDKLNLSPCCAMDCSTGANGQPTGFMEFTPSGVINVIPRVITAGDNGLRIGNRSSMADNELRRHQVANGGVDTNQLTQSQGALITGKIGADVYSELSFKAFDAAYTTAGTSDPIDIYVAVVDEEQRVKNQLAVGGDTEMGVSDPVYGNVSDPAFAPVADGAMNPSLLVFRLKNQVPLPANGGSENSIYPNGIYYRDSFNANNDFNVNSIVQAPWVAISTDNFTWNPDANPNTLFLVKTYATAGFSELWASDNGKKEDAVLVQKIRHNRINTSGIRTATINNAGSAYDVNDTLRFRATTTGDARTNAIFDIATDGAGVLNGAVSVICAGSGYTNGQTLKLIEIDPTTGIDVAATGADATVDIGALVAYQNTGNRGTAYDATKTHQGYSYFMAVGSYDTVRTTQQAIYDINLAVENAFNVNSEYAEIHPRVEAGFGNLIGMFKSRYILDKQTGWTATSDGQPQPDGATATHPLLHVYADNLPVKSYVGKRYQQNATINDNPVGNQQGLTHLIAQVPRHHDDNGEAGSANTGPYYFDYFPYSIPLHNATQLLRNELEISVRNPDGTLATDITRSLILLDVSNVDNVGEGLTGGNIGDPRDRPQNYAQRDIGKNQLQPTIQGGSFQGSVSRHEDSDVNNTAISSGKDKSATLF